MTLYHGVENARELPKSLMSPILFKKKLFDQSKLFPINLRFYHNQRYLSFAPIRNLHATLLGHLYLKGNGIMISFSIFIQLLYFEFYN